MPMYPGAILTLMIDLYYSIRLQVLVSFRLMDSDSGQPLNKRTVIFFNSSDFMYTEFTHVH